jgi:hypothetical protein
VVAGGGGGGTDYAGGGGAGGLLTGSGVTIDPNSTYLVTVGSGGAAKTQGNSSSFSAVATTAVGGGYGGGNSAPASGGSGGSGGGKAGANAAGSAGSGTSGQGFAGGTSAAFGTAGGGGGGGASAVGSNGLQFAGGAGGAGTASSISGSSVPYAGGGGGGGYTPSGTTAGAGGTGGGGAGAASGAGTAGTANLGGGGGGGAGASGAGGSGGSGVVIISYAGATQLMAGGTVTISGGNVIHTFTSTGFLAPIDFVGNSLRFRSSASAYLNRTPTVASNRDTWTWSGWVKRGSLSSLQFLFQQGADQNNASSFRFNSGDTLEYNHADGGTNTDQCITSAVFRDPAAWYHLVLSVDTTQATDTDRIKIYVNGNLQTLGTANYPAQNVDTDVNTTSPFRIGSQVAGTPYYFDGYQTEVNFIDGQALTPSSFGTINSYGVWQPITYGGSYGTNGFYLPFTNATSTTTLGFDFSPNGNNWTTNNISLTAGTTYDSMTDVPTLTSATAANFATLNPLTLYTTQASLTEGNLYAIPITGASNWGTVFSTITIPTSGKWYIEAVATVFGGSGNNSSLGVVDSSTFTPTNTAVLWQYTTGEGFDGILCHLFSDYVAPISDGVQGTNITGITGTSVNLMLALDVDNGKVFAGYNGIWLNSGDPAAGTGQVALRTFSASDVVTGNVAWNSPNNQSQYFNFGQRPFTYTPPTGFLRLNTFNM